MIHVKSVAQPISQCRNKCVILAMTLLWVGQIEPSWAQSETIFLTLPYGSETRATLRLTSITWRVPGRRMILLMPIAARC